MAIDATDLHEMIDWQNGLISPRIFIEDEIYQLELERLFGRTWLFLAHDSMIANPGDFYSTYMGGDPVIIARQKDGSVKAFLNVCRHRGMKVCRAEEGNSNAFMCTYHGWTYDGSGALVSVPNFEDAYYGELEMSKWGLVPVRVESYKGLWFGNFDESAPSLIDYLGDMTYYMDGWLDRTPGGIEVVGVVKWVINGNWKIAAEQFAGDGYHAQVTHLSSPRHGLNPDYAKIDRRVGRQYGSRLGHGQGFGGGGSAQPQAPQPGKPMPFNGFGMDKVSEYNLEQLPKRKERLGETRPLGGHFTVFPNFSGLGGAANIRVWQPKGPNKFEIWSFTIVDKDAPEDVKRAQAMGSVHTEGAAGMVEIDDGENWNLIGEILTNGQRSRELMWHYAMGLGHEHGNDPTFPGTIGNHSWGELPQRAFYRRYLEFLSSESWPYVDPAEVDLREQVSNRS